MSEPKRRPVPPARSTLHPPQRPARNAPTAGLATATGSSHVLWVAAGVVLSIVGVLCLVLVGLLVVRLLTKDSGGEVQIAETDNASAQTVASDDSEPSNLHKPVSEQSDNHEPVIDADLLPDASKSGLDETPEPVVPDVEPPPKSTDEVSIEPAPEPHQPLDDVRQRNLRLALPSQENTAALEVAKVYVDSSAQCELKLLGAECFASAEGSYQLEMKDVDDARRDWKLLLKPAAGVGSGLHLGTFSLQQQSLSFAWQPMKGSPRSFAFQYCLLQIKAGDEALSCRLADPVEAALPPFTFAGGRASIKIPFPQLTACDGKRLRVKVVAPQFADQAFDPGDTLKLDESTRLTILDPGISDENGPAPVTLEFQFRKKDLEPELSMTCRAKVPKYKIILPPKAAKLDVKFTEGPADPKLGATAPQKILEGIGKLRPPTEARKAQFEKQLTNKQEQLNNAANVMLLQQLQFDVNALSAVLTGIDNSLAELQRAEDAANAWQSWNDAMQALQTNLSGETGVQIELFVEIEGETVTLYRSR